MYVYVQAGVLYGCVYSAMSGGMVRDWGKGRCGVWEECLENSVER